MDITAIADALRRGEIDLISPPPDRYEFRPFPKAKFHHSEPTRIVESEREERSLGPAWGDSPEDATRRYHAQQEAYADDAAVREFDDRHLGELARRELRRYEQQAESHVLDVPAKQES